MGNRWNKTKEWFDKPRNRPKVLLGTVALAICGTILLEFLMRQDFMVGVRDLIKHSGFVGDIFFPAAAPDWKDKLTALLPIIGLPTAFWLWHWRDRNVQDQITEQRNEVENHREEINNQRIELQIQNSQVEIQKEQIANQRREIFLKEFQEVQRQSAGLFEISGSDSAKEQLQISALYQLRSFLSEDNLKTFRMAAFETLMAGHAEAMRRIGVGDWPSDLKKKDALQRWRNTLDPVMKERINIIEQELNNIIIQKFSLNGRRLDLIKLVAHKFPKNTDFGQASLIGVDFAFSNIENSNFSGCKLEYADLSFTNLQNSDFEYSNLNGADLSNANLAGVKLGDAYIDEQTELSQAKYDESTSFSQTWIDDTSEEIQEQEKRWTSRGLKRL